MHYLNYFRNNILSAVDRHRKIILHLCPSRGHVLYFYRRKYTEYHRVFILSFMYVHLSTFNYKVRVFICVSCIHVQYLGPYYQVLGTMHMMFVMSKTCMLCFPSIFYLYYTIILYYCVSLPPNL